MEAATTDSERKIEIRMKLDQRTLALLDEQAEAFGLSRSDYVKRLVEEMDETDETDSGLLEEAERRLDDPNAEYVPWEQARRELGL